MENPGNVSVGFCLLPSELIQYILVNLAFPEIIRLKSLNKSISQLISDQVFIRDYNSRSKSTSWLFVYKKRWHRDAVLHGFSDHSDRWFKLQIANLLKPIIPPGETIYFLASTANIFLFSCNTLKEVIAVDLGNKTVKKIPESPLGPRGTSSWRRSGMKLVGGSDSFRFLFAELVNEQPVLYVYSSESGRWQTKVAEAEVSDRIERDKGDCIFVNVVNGPHESVIISVGLESYEDPVVIRARLRLNGGGENVIDKLHVYGDGQMLIIKSKAEREGRMLNEIEVWGLGREWEWELKTRVPKRIIEEIKKEYRVIMGCLEKREGVIRVALMSNYEGLWDIIWLSYHIEACYWTWIPLPNITTNMKGLNMAGISFSSSLTL
ncbi:uncharacterized protein [Euphorbia lathyris]|uniref:uncharacterized protein n=1 Tax=Euphorbia lathyris TaxID=212925 RepID=UPI00331372FC